MATEMVPLITSNHSQAQANGEPSNHHLIVNVDNDLLSSAQERIKELPKLLNKSASKETCCIFRVPRSLVEINEKACQPHIISIGPYHHGKQHLRMIEEHKGRLFGNLLNRCRDRRVGLEQFFQAVASMEEAIRECYSETIAYSSRELIEMMVFDGCFIIELFCVVGGLAPGRDYYDDPIFNMQWVFFYLVRDLLLLENQIPFFVLQELFRLSVSPSTEENVPSLVRLALGFLNYASSTPGGVLDGFTDLQEKHLLDIFRLSLLPSTPESRRKVTSPDPPLIKSAKNLQVAGVHFRPRETNSVLDIKFSRGVLEIPKLTIDDFTSSVILNCVAFEQCYKHRSKDITSYAVFMRCLINTPSDAELLCDHKIIENYFGPNEEVTRFFHDVGKDVAFDIEQSYLLELFEDVNKHYNNVWHVRWAGFKHTYFDTPWSIVSALAAVILLIFSFISAFFAIYAYILPPK